LIIRWTTSLILLSVLFTPQQAVHAQTKPKRLELGQAPESILWVGNSFFYYNSMHNHFGASFLRPVRDLSYVALL
jgi:hypothetical protein